MSCPHRPSRRGISAVAGACLALGACTTAPVALDAPPPAPAVAQKVTRPVAFLHASSLRNDVQVVEPYGNEYYLRLKTGAASDRALRAAYAQVFDAPVEVDAPGPLRGRDGAQAPIALIEPSIVRLDYVNASARMWGPFFAQITYRFVIADASGAPVAHWRVVGIGQYDPSVPRPQPPPNGETAMLAEAPRLAIGDAAADFMRSFARVPELIRLIRNLPPAGADVDAGLQVLHDAGPAAPGIEATYPDVLMLRVQRAALPAPPPDVAKDIPRLPQIAPVRLTLYNLGMHRLAVNPGDIEWRPAGGGEPPLAPLPAPVVTALFAGRPFGLVVGAMSPGAGMLPGVLAAIVNATENERQKKAFAAWSLAVERDLLDFDVAAAGRSRGGMVYFLRAPGLDGGTLVVPVIDLDDATRYAVRVPMPPG